MFAAKGVVLKEKEKGKNRHRKQNSEGNKTLSCLGRESNHWELVTTNDGWDALVSKASLVVQSTEVDGKEKGERVEDVLLHKETELEEPLHWCHLGGLCSGGGGS